MDACRLTNGDYKVGWVCALPVELSAAMAMLDEKHPQLPKEQRDPNAYVLGRIGRHNVAITCLPAGRMGTISAAAVVTQMVSSFKSIEFGLMVGIGGGVPSAKHDIRLGDVVVSVPGPRCGGVIQYDFGKTVSGGQFIRTGSLNSPSPMLLAAINVLQAKHALESDQPTHYLSVMNNLRLSREYTYQGAEYDQLFEATYDHNIGGDGTCEECDTSKLLQRSDRGSSDPVVHYGVIASGNSVVKDGAIRDRLGETDDVLCFEMEAAGLMDNLPSIVIRGICDYADSHKNKRWQQYAAATAATYAKELLGIIQHQVTQSEGNQSQRQDRDADMQSAPNPQIGYYNDTFSTVHNRASVFVKNGKYGDALKCYRAILDGHTEALADDPKAHSILPPSAI
jgi:nucleoside phosphorylase